MASDLIDNINSDYISTYNGMAPTGAPEVLIAYVEDTLDVPFWSKILKEHESNNLKININTIENLQRGKQSCLDKILQNTGDSLIACVDSDFDYLLQNENIINNNYVFHTYLYSIENFKCQSTSLKQLCIEITLNSSVDFDFDKFLVEYSVVIYELLIAQLWVKNALMQSSYEFASFCEDVSLMTFDLNDKGANSLIQLQQTKELRIQSLKNNIPEFTDLILEEFSMSLKSLGLTKENTYLFIQGHTLFDKVLLPILKPICRNLVRDVYSDINNSQADTVDKNNRRNQYKSQLGQKQKIDDRVSMFLESYNHFYRNEFYSKIKSDLNAFFENRNN